MEGKYFFPKNYYGGKIFLNAQQEEAQMVDKILNFIKPLNENRFYDPLIVQVLRKTVLE